MINYILHSITELKEFIILVLVATCLLFAMVLLFATRKKTAISQFYLQRLFLGLNLKEVVFLAFGILEVIYAISMILFRKDFTTVQIASVIVLLLARIVTSPSIKMILPEVVLSAIFAASFLIGNLLLDYLSETGFDLYIFLICSLLSLFVIIYSIFHVVKTTGNMAECHERRRGYEN